MLPLDVAVVKVLLQASPATGDCVGGRALADKLLTTLQVQPDSQPGAAAARLQRPDIASTDDR